MRNFLYRAPFSLIAALLCAGSALAHTIKVPYVSISGFQAPLYLGERAGLFKKNQLDAQLIYMPGGSLIVQTLLSGEVGIGSLAPPSAVSASQSRSTSAWSLQVTDREIASLN